MQVAVGSPLGAANCISLPQGAASQIPIMKRECEYGSVIHSYVWGAVCKNIISDRFSTKTAISGRDSYLCVQRCYLWQR